MEYVYGFRVDLSPSFAVTQLIIMALYQADSTFPQPREPQRQPSSSDSHMVAYKMSLAPLEAVPLATSTALARNLVSG